MVMASVIFISANWKDLMFFIAILATGSLRTLRKAPALLAPTNSQLAQFLPTLMEMETLIFWLIPLVAAHGRF